MKEVEPTHSVSFCSMNNGNPIVLDVEAIYQEKRMNRKFKNWLNHGGKLSLEDFGSNTMKDRKEIWGIVEEYRVQCYEKAKSRYMNSDFAETIREIRSKKGKKKIRIQTSKGVVERDPVIVFTRPFYDFATWYTYSWSDELIQESSKKALVIDLGLELANRKNLETVFAELSPQIYVHYGHGSPHSMIGQGGRDNILIDDDNCDILHNCQVYSVACHTARHLGEVAIKKGCIVWMGYNEDFRFVTKFNALDVRLRKIFELLRKKGEVTLEDMSKITHDIRMLIVRCLEHNRDSLKLVGDGSARTLDWRNLS